VEGVAADPRYLDLSIAPGVTKTLAVEVDRHAFAYVFEGSGWFHAASAPQGVLLEDLATDRTVRAAPAKNRYLVLFDRGDEIRVSAGPEGLRFLLASGRPLGEPVAWHGPIVMNTQAELDQAMRELQDGSFIKDNS
jgi:redox-sensitive bicupin YhaK (pirin superfamily)